MPNTSSAKKALRQSTKRKEVNVARKRNLKDKIKAFKKAVEGGDIKSATEQLPTVYKTLDKAAKVNLIKKNKASRLKSRLTKKLPEKTATK
jgi:small subunit ribosomal protein S20